MGWKAYNLFEIQLKKKIWTERKKFNIKVLYKLPKE